MIPRYSRKEIRKIWEPENKFKIWLDIEIAICEALEKIGVIPKDAVKNIKTNSSFNVSRIDQIEKEVKRASPTRLSLCTYPTLVKNLLSFEQSRLSPKKK